MSVTRFVSFKDASTEDEAETFVVVDAGSAVLPVVGRTKKVTGGFQVEVYSLDGHRTEPGGVPVAAHTSPQNSAATIHQYEMIANALVDGEVLQERKEFESVADGTPGPRTKGVSYKNTHGRFDGWEPRNNPAKPAGQE